MKNSILLLVLFSAALFSVNGQNAHCGFDEHLDKMLSEDPSGIQIIKDRQARAQEHTRQRLAGEVERAGGPRIIPTVFHIIHQGGNENISVEQIEDQMRILNEDFIHSRIEVDWTGRYSAVAVDWHPFMTGEQTDNCDTNTAQSGSLKSCRS